MSQICCPIFGLDSGSFGLCDLNAPLGGSLFAGVRFWTGRGSQLLNAGSKDGPVQVSPPPADGSLKSPRTSPRSKGWGLAEFETAELAQ